MRKVTFLTMAVLLVSLCLGANAFAGLDWGLKGGLSAANVIGEDNAVSNLTPGNRLGLSAGGYLNWKTPWTIDFLSVNVNFQTEMLYTMRGAKYTTDIQDYTLAYDYLEFPVIMKLTSNKDKAIHASLYGGISAGVKVKSEVTATSSNLNLATSAADTLLMSAVGEVSSLNDYDAGLLLGVDFDLANEMFLFDIRYYMGVTKLPQGANPADIRNSDLMILMGFKF